MKENILNLDPAQRLEAIKKQFYRSLPENKHEMLLIPDVQIRAMDPPDDESGMKLEGYAAVFGKLSEGLWFTEKIQRGAFEETIKEDDIVGLFNHDKNFVLSRNTANTLNLEEDNKGLKYIMDLPDSNAAMDTYKSVKRGDVNGSSFSFRAQEELWDYGEDGETVIRTLIKVKLYDVGPVTFPAYPDTTSAARSLNNWLEEQKTAAGEIPWRLNIARRRLNLAAQQ